MAHQSVVISPPREAHREGCLFGPGFFRIQMRNGTRRFCRSEGEVELVHHLLPDDSILAVQRDGYCLDEHEAFSDGRTPDVIDGDRFLALPRDEAMRLAGITSDADYARAYRAIEEMVVARDNRASQTGVRASIVVKKAGARVIDV